MSFWDWVPSVVEEVVPFIEPAVKTFGAIESIDTQKDVGDIYAKSRAESLEKAKEREKVALPGVQHLRGVIGRAETVSPAQESNIERAKRTALDALKGGGLRGSARATASTVKDVEGSLRDQALEQNRQRADTAATRLAGGYTGASRDISSGLMDTASDKATTTQNVSAIKGRAIGDIASVISDQLKKDRTSAYDEVGDY